VLSTGFALFWARKIVKKGEKNAFCEKRDKNAGFWCV
jgi:hypothetical protein